MRVSERLHGMLPPVVGLAEEKLIPLVRCVNYDASEYSNRRVSRGGGNFVQRESLLGPLAPGGQRRTGTADAQRPRDPGSVAR